MPRIFTRAHSVGEFKTKTAMGVQERRKQDVRERAAPKEGGYKPRQHLG